MDNVRTQANAGRRAEAESVVFGQESPPLLAGGVG